MIVQTSNGDGAMNHSTKKEIVSMNASELSEAVIQAAEEMGYREKEGRVYVDCNVIPSGLTTAEVVHVLYNHVAHQCGHPAKSMDEISRCLEGAIPNSQGCVCIHTDSIDNLLYHLAKVGDVVFDCDVYRTRMDITEFVKAHGDMADVVKGAWARRIHDKVALQVQEAKLEPSLCQPTLQGCLAAIGLLVMSLSLSARGAERIVYNDARFDYEPVEDGIRITRVLGSKGSSTNGYKMPGDDLFFPDQIGGVDVVEIASNACKSVYTRGGNTFRNLIMFPAKLKRLGAIALPSYETFIYNYRFPKTLVTIDNLFNSGTDNDNGISIFDGPPPNFIGAFVQGFYYGGPLGGFRYPHSTYASVYVNDLYYDEYLSKSSFVGNNGVCVAGYYYMGALLCRGMPGVIIHYNSEFLTLNDKVSITCTSADAEIYYTVDGSKPVTNLTAYCYKYNSPIVLEHPTILRVVATAPGYPYATYEEQSFTVDQPNAPVVRAVNAVVFNARGFEVEITSESVNGVVRYTTDGSEVTDDSPIYTGVFQIADTTTVRAKVFEPNRFASEEATATFTREWYTVEQPVIEPSGATFGNVSQEVSISCETDGAIILYTTDGSDPAVNGRGYKYPFNIYQSCTVRAIARKYDWKDSPEATATFTRSDSLSEAANLYGYTMETGGDASWTVDTDVSHDGVSSVRSGVIDNDGTTYLQTSVRKAGTVSFWWKAMCENAEVEDGETYYYDFGSFSVDGEVKARIAGNDTGWQFVSVDVPSGGKHTLRWAYAKDDSTSYAPDCMWLDQVQWVPADGSGFTMTTPEPVPYSWLSNYGFGGLEADFETAANSLNGKLDGAGKQLSVWQDYVAGTDPTNVASRIKARIEMRGNEPFVSWEPDLNENGTKSERLYKVYGSETLEGGGDWQYPTNSLHRFFKVTVEMP